MFPGPGPTLDTLPSNTDPTIDKSAETKPSVKEGTKDVTPHAGPDATPEVTDTADPAATGSSSVATKREGTEQESVEPSPAGNDRLDPAPTSAPAAKGRASKNSTPVAATFPEAVQQRSRPSRNTDATGVKRSHKKGGSLAAIQQAAATEDEESSREGDDEDDDGEPRYCYCNEISFGEMVACDNDACPREWFHLSCVGLTKPPGKNGESLSIVLSPVVCQC